MTAQGNNAITQLIAPAIFSWEKCQRQHPGRDLSAYYKPAKKGKPGSLQVSHKHPGAQWRLAGTETIAPSLTKEDVTAWLTAIANTLPITASSEDQPKHPSYPYSGAQNITQFALEHGYTGDTQVWALEGFIVSHQNQGIFDFLTIEGISNGALS